MSLFRHQLCLISRYRKAVGATDPVFDFEAILKSKDGRYGISFDLVGRVGIGSARVNLVVQIGRCAANRCRSLRVEFRNLNILKTLMQTFGTVACGGFAAVTIGGKIGRDDDLEDILRQR
jgi:hypothetical protein